MSPSAIFASGEATNNLLTTLRPDDFDLLRPHLEKSSTVPGTILYQPGDDVRRVYFPCGPTLLAFRIILEDGKAVEVAMIGREGAVAGIVSQGKLPAYSRAEVQFGGPVLSMDVAELERAKMKSISLRYLFARYADCLMAQVFQSVACNAAHTIEQRACKWIVAAMERTGETTLPLTQEQLSAMLGVGRTYVSRVMQGFKSRQLIEIRRGRLVASNPAGLKQIACSCHESVKQHFDEVLHGVYPDEGLKLIPEPT
jgi:hypothetical protein